MSRSAILVALAFALGACTSSSASRTPTAVLGANLPRCAEDARWGCGFTTVPIDRANPAGGTIKIAFFVQGHIDTTKPALEPIFVSPGGPGASIWTDHNYLPLLSWDVRHDTVLIEPRGVGRSGAIMCPALQAGVSTFAALRTATSACAAQLGPAADRYGSGDVALDIEDVRKALGVASLDLYAASYGTIAEQAYVTRFPKRVHALVLDSAYPAVDPVKSYALGIGYLAGWMRILKLLCQRTPDCVSAYPQPQDLVDWLVRRVASGPIRESGGGATGATIVDEAAVEGMLASFGPNGDQLHAKDLLDAAAALKSGDKGPIVGLASQWPVLAVGTPQDADSFSNGDNAAAACNDQDFPWDRADDASVRATKLTAAYTALPADTFAPFTTAGWAAGNLFPDSCITWPSPARYEPVIPAGATFPAVPTLIINGDEDTSAPLEISHGILGEFPGATVLVVAGAGHDAAAPFWTSCGGPAVAMFFDTLRVDPNACAKFGS